MSIELSQDIPWHVNQWQQIAKMRAQNRMPHALLLEGRQGLGKHQFATKLAQHLLCQTTHSNDLVCQQCANCVWFNNGSHPDFHILRPEEGKMLISVDAIRLTIKKVVQTTHQSGYRVLLIDPADAMTTEAANSLLKTLEEPPQQTLIMLLTDKPARLLPTIRSRASRIRFIEPEKETAIRWLQNMGLNKDEALQAFALSHGAPLRYSVESSELQALLSKTQLWWKSWRDLYQQSRSPVQVAKEWKDADPHVFLSWLENLINTLIKQKMHASQDVMNSSLFPDLQNYADQSSISNLYSVRDRVLNLLQKLNTSLNWGLQLESLAIECQSLNS